jgi:hypothetical protein
MFHRHAGAMPGVAGILFTALAILVALAMAWAGPQALAGTLGTPNREATFGIDLAVAGKSLDTSTPTTTPTSTPTQTCVPWDVVASPDGGTGMENQLHAVGVVSATDIWAVGYYGFYDVGFGCCHDTLVEHWDGAQWSIVPSPNPADGRDNRLLGIVVLSASDIWAVGSSGTGTFGTIRTLIEHWDGAQWSIVPSPNGTGLSGLEGVSALSANEVWAAGTIVNIGVGSQTLVERWDGVQWSIVPSPNPSAYNRLRSLAALSSTDIWAVGASGDNNFTSAQSLVLHWNGTAWSRVPSPNGGSSYNTLNALAVVSANDIWAVGQSAPDQNAYGQGLTLHWNGSVWSAVPNPNFDDVRLNGAVAISSRDVWAVGGTSTGALAEHWNGAAWAVVPVPELSSRLYDVGAVSTDDVWAVGVRFTSTANVNYTLVEHYTGPRCCTITFADVHSNDYFYEAVRYLYCHGVISGYSDNTFRPYNLTTRAQLAKIVVLAEGWTTYTPTNPSFRDVSATDPFYQFIETAYHQGVISGYSCGPDCLEYRPGNNVTRGQLAKIIVLAEGWPLYTPPNPTFRDVPQGDPFFSYIETAYSHGVISGYNCGAGCLEFRTGNNATRGQICKIVFSAISAPGKVSTQRCCSTGTPRAARDPSVATSGPA